MTSLFCCCFRHRSEYETLDDTNHNGEKEGRSVDLKKVRHLATSFTTPKHTQKALPFSPRDLMEFIADPDQVVYVGFGDDQDFFYSNNIFQLISNYNHTSSITISAINASSRESLTLTSENGKGYTITFTLQDKNTYEEGTFQVGLPSIHDKGLCFKMNVRHHIRGNLRDRFILSHKNNVDYEYC